MAGGVLNLGGITVFEANGSFIDVPSGTVIRGLTTASGLDVFVNNAVFSSTTNLLTLTTTDGNTLNVDLSSLDAAAAADADATALAIALG